MKYSTFDMENPKESGTYFEGSDKKYPNVELPRWMKDLEED